MAKTPARASVVAMEERIDAMARDWWAVLLRGVVAIAFAAVAWARPGPTLAILLVLAGAYLIGDGIFALAGAIRAATRRESWWAMAFEGVLGIALGIFALARPGKAMMLAVVLVAVWAICTGVLELIESVRLRRFLPNDSLLAASGIVRLGFGVLFLTRPGAGALTLLWIAASYALIDGVLLVGLAVRLRNFRERRRQRPAGGGVTMQPV